MAVSLDTDSIYQIDYESYSTEALRVNEAQFGDGYKQSIQDGINADEDTWYLSFVSLISSSATTLVGILKQSKNGTANVIAWTPPNESTTKYWEATDIKNDPESYNYYKVSCTLTRVFPII